MVTTTRLNPCGLGMALGVMWGGYLFLLALLSNLGTIYFNNATVAMIQTLIPWYAVGVAGAFLGFITGALCGFICGFILILIYNKVASGHSCSICR